MSAGVWVTDVVVDTLGELVAGVVVGVRVGGCIIAIAGEPRPRGQWSFDVLLCAAPWVWSVMVNRSLFVRIPPASLLETAMPTVPLRL